jgi:hypothetical protein
VRAMDIRRRTTDEVNRHQEIPPDVREKFDLKRLDELSGRLVEVSLQGQKLFRVNLPLRLNRTRFLHPVIDRQWSGLLEAFGLPARCDGGQLTEAQGEVFRPLRRLASACAVEDALNRLIREAGDWMARTLVTVDPDLLRYIPGVDSIAPTLQPDATMEENTRGVEESYPRYLAWIDERAELPFVEDPDVADALRRAIRDKGVETTQRFFLELALRRKADNSSVMFPRHVVQGLVKEAQSKRARETGGGRPSLLEKLGPEAPLIARTFDRQKVPSKEAARRMGISPSAYKSLRRETPPSSRPTDEQVLILAKQYDFEPADAFAVLEAMYRGRRRRR